MQWVYESSYVRCIVVCRQGLEHTFTWYQDRLSDSLIFILLVWVMSTLVTVYTWVRYWGCSRINMKQGHCFVTCCRNETSVLLVFVEWVGLMPSQTYESDVDRTFFKDFLDMCQFCICSLLSFRTCDSNSYGGHLAGWKKRCSFSPREYYWRGFKVEHPRQVDDLHVKLWPSIGLSRFLFRKQIRPRPVWDVEVCQWAVYSHRRMNIWGVHRSLCSRCWSVARQ